MKYFKVLVAFTIVTGKVHLTDAQAEARKAFLSPLDAKEHGENRFATKAPIGFKQGEIFGLEGELGERTAELLGERSQPFDKQVQKERQTAAEAKAAVLKTRADREAAIKRVKAEREAAAAEKRAAAQAARTA